MAEIEPIDWDGSYRPKSAEGQLFAGLIEKINELIAAHNALEARLHDLEINNGKR